MKFAVLVAALAAVALGACRREMPHYEPMKLGGPVDVDRSSR